MWAVLWRVSQIRVRQMPKCPGCKNNEKASWCKIRQCCISKGYHTCAVKCVYSLDVPIWMRIIYSIP